MLKQVFKIAAELRKIAAPENLTIQQIIEMFRNVSVIDQIYFVQYESTPQNPIWGEFTRWSQRPSVYASMETAVEIRYASHLLQQADWLRFVICKELCHALEVSDGSHDASNATIVDLVARFSMMSHRQDQDEISYAYSIEIMAEVGALEILCPLETRKAIIAAEGQLNGNRLAELAQQYHLPITLIGWAFSPECIAAVEDLMA